MIQNEILQKWKMYFVSFLEIKKGFRQAQKETVYSESVDFFR